jgi:hypothetical protein
MVMNAYSILVMRRETTDHPLTSANHPGCPPRSRPPRGHDRVAASLVSHDWGQPTAVRRPGGRAGVLRELPAGAMASLALAGVGERAG